MSVGNVSSSSGGIDRSGERPLRADSKRNDTSRRADSGDRAAISSDGLDAAASFDARVAAASADDAQRIVQVERAMQRLMSGELDRPEVYRATAEQIAAADFRTV